MDHALPHIEASIDTRRDRALHQVDRIIEQNLIIADMHTDRG
jgi:hypothetical protein